MRECGTRIYRCNSMTMDTLERTSHLFAVSEGMPPVEVIDGKSVVRGLKVFRTGTFKDSLGRQRTWTIDDLNKFAENFSKLQGVFPSPPVRADHGASVDRLKGYVTAVRVEGEFLVNDIEFTEPDGAEKYTRKTYRNRSIEVGPYETNGATPVTLWPAQTGLAFVDIPAVEGLGFRRESTEDNPVTVTFRIRGVETQNMDDVQSYIRELETANVDLAKRPELGHAFRIAGADESDFTKVQTHIAALETSHAALETFRTEQLEAGRSTFVDTLVRENKIAAPQADELKAFAKALDQEAFAAWCKTYEKAPKLFTNKVGTGDGNEGNGEAPTPAEQQLADDREVVAMHRRSGTMTDAALKETASYRRLVAADPTAAIV